MKTKTEKKPKSFRQFLQLTPKFCCLHSGNLMFNVNKSHANHDVNLILRSVYGWISPKTDLNCLLCLARSFMKQ
ncbi:CLUMA_CG020681, isoform A [Clunio marinus]|uniref:CLUMA_CG020681, isoform A n=1 Tax=Clunio marinus TaxID=568069 RepID=A0A1J1J5Q5_9DIPT|nr:CLUMA_CG020681, isoform A [Clunio marinus]